MKRRLIGAIFLGLLGAAASARDVTLCMTDREFLPINSSKFEAPGQYLVRMALES